MSDILTRCERAVFEHIGTLEDKYQIANPSVKQICDAVIYSKSAVQAALSHMENMGIIGVDRKGRQKQPGDDAPQRWIRRIVLSLLESKKTLLASKENLPDSRKLDHLYTLSTAPVIDESRHGDPVDHYWKHMDYIERNTDAQKAAARSAQAAPIAARQLTLDDEPWPW